MRIAIMLIATIVGGWLTFDGTRALVSGDYVTRDGQLGPWSRVVSAVGIEPRGRVMKIAHVAMGLLWLAALGAFMAGAFGAGTALMICAALSLWYLPLGTLLGAAEILLVFLFERKGLAE